MVATCYHDYYIQQAGSGIGAIYKGSPYQKGNGFGGFLKGLFRSVMPLLRSGLKTIGKETITSGAQFLNDVVNEKPVVESLKSRAIESMENIKRKAKNTIDGLMGSGCIKKRRTRERNQKRSVFGRVKKRRVKVQTSKSSDIFG